MIKQEKNFSQKNRWQRKITRRNIQHIKWSLQKDVSKIDFSKRHYQNCSLKKEIMAVLSFILFYFRIIRENFQIVSISSHLFRFSMYLHSFRKTCQKQFSCFFHPYFYFNLVFTNFLLQIFLQSSSFFITADFVSNIIIIFQQIIIFDRKTHPFSFSIITFRQQYA